MQTTLTWPSTKAPTAMGIFRRVLLRLLFVVNDGGPHVPFAVANFAKGQEEYILVPKVPPLM